MKKNKLHNNGGFTTPKDYFANLEDKLDAINTTNTSSKEAFLTTNSHGFKTPESYFTDLDTRITNNEANVIKKGKVITLFSKKQLLPLIGLAACLAIVISIAINQKSPLNFESLQVADIHEYINEEGITFTDNEIENLSENILYSDILFDELNDDTIIEEYLSENDLYDESLYIE